MSPLRTSAPSYVTLAEPWAIYLLTPLYVLPNLITTTGSCLEVSSSPLPLGTEGPEVWGQLAPSIMLFFTDCNSLAAYKLVGTNMPVDLARSGERRRNWEGEKSGVRIDLHLKQ